MLSNFWRELLPQSIVIFLKILCPDHPYQNHLRCFSKEHILGLFSDSSVSEPSDGGLWIFPVCFDKLAQMTCMYTRFENLWLGGRRSARPLTDPCPTYRYFCWNSMFAFLKKVLILQNRKLKISGLLGKVGLGEEKWKRMEL